MSEKIQKLLAHAGYGSRREIEGWISDGRISVNGKRATLGERATARDRILLDGQLVQLTARSSDTIKALIYHKPEGQICTRKDPKGRPTIFDNLPPISGGRWVSVGRLDINTSGLIIMTNSGDLANKLMHPSTGLDREYLVRIRGRASPETIKKLTGSGVKIDGKSAHFESVVAANLTEQGSNHWYRVVIKEGRYREVRRLWDAVGHEVSRLKRIRYGTVKLTRDLKQGKYTKMAPRQLERLVRSVGLEQQFQAQLYSARSPGGKAAAGKPASHKNARHKTARRQPSAPAKPAQRKR